jgi:hypothetical protein
MSQETPIPLKCCVCFEERPERCISVFQETGQPDLPYCNDRVVCIAMAKTKRLTASNRAANPPVNTLNVFGVGVVSGDIAILEFNRRIKRADAINLAVWIKLLVMDDAEFARVEEAIQKT